MAGTEPSNLQPHLKAQWSRDGLLPFFLLDPGSSQGSFGTLTPAAFLAPIVRLPLVSHFVGAQCTPPRKFLYVASYMCQDSSGGPSRGLVLQVCGIQCLLSRDGFHCFGVQAPSLR